MRRAAAPQCMRELEPISVSSDLPVAYYRITTGKTIGIKEDLGVYA